MFGLAAIAHYKAFSIGPVRLVAPIIGSYPILSVGWAMLTGTPISVLQWMAVGLVIAGVGYVAISDDKEADWQDPTPAILWSIAAGTGFAITFATGQSAAKLLHEIPATLITRGVAVCLTIGVILAMRERFWPGWKALPWLLTMGLADGIALYSVISAGGLRNEHFAAVSSSMFGLLTIVFAWIFLKEKMTAAQWGGCLIAFAGVGYLAI